jgi:hypothetical protein
LPKRYYRMYTKLVLAFFMCCLFQQSAAQRLDSSIFAAPITMDTVVINAIEAGWDVSAFIKKMQSDTSFYSAFRSLHFCNYEQQTQLYAYDAAGIKTDSLYLKSKQLYKNHCRSTQLIEQKFNPHFYTSKGAYRYYTAILFDYLFFNKNTICNEPQQPVNTPINDNKSSYLEKSKAQLKQLLFNPGSNIKGIPFIGNKAAIFDKEELYKYEFTLSSGWWNDEACWIFSIKPKAAYKEELIYNTLKTWFRKEDDAIVKRVYSLSYATWFYQFDVSMQVHMINVDKKIKPSYLQYKGYWHILGKTKERLSCTSTLSYP